METHRRDLSWKELVVKSWGKEYAAPEVAYVFSGGRKFYDRGEPMVGDGLEIDSFYADFYSDHYA